MRRNYMITQPQLKAPHIYLAFEYAMRAFLNCIAGTKLYEITAEGKTLIIEK